METKNFNKYLSNGLDAINGYEREMTSIPNHFGIDQNVNTVVPTTRLLPLGNMPKHLQFNKFVLTGYRPPMKTWDCLLSLTYFHNETINILSHGLPLLYAIWNLPKLLPWKAMPLPVLSCLHAAATVCPWLGSSIYHLFMNHHSGVLTYERLLKWDVVGVWVTQSCGGFASVYIGIMCLPKPLRCLLLGTYVIFAVRSLHAAVYAVGPWQRRSSFAAMFIMRIGILFIRMSKYGGGHPEALYHVFMQDFWSLVGAVVSATLVPERWKPGRFDYIFNSHNIMHVLVVLGGLHMHWAMQKDLVWAAEWLNPK